MFDGDDVSIHYGRKYEVDLYAFSWRRLLGNFLASQIPKARLTHLIGGRWR